MNILKRISSLMVFKSLFLMITMVAGNMAFAGTISPSCPTGTSYTQVGGSGACVSVTYTSPSCPSYATYSNGSCIEIDSFPAENNTCPTDYFYTGGNCKRITYHSPSCPSSYVYSGGNCVKRSYSTPYCPSRYTMTRDGMCTNQRR